MDVTIVVATYGSNEWINIANNFAMPNAASFNVPIVRVHGGSSLAEARNAGAALVRTEWICFLDADDELSADYFEEMGKATGDLRAPRLLFCDIEQDTVSEPFDLTRRNMAVGNPCPIGTLIRKSMFEDVGKFWEEPVYEDWSLFRRAWLLGATIEHTNARYLAYNLGGRNSPPDNVHEVLEQIKSSHETWMMEVM